jgi:cyclic pyranopterin phosphate synthase
VKIRLTGGEPLLRKNIERLIAMLAEMKTVSGKPLDLTLTTNASLLARKAQSLKDAGLQRVTVSLDALDNATFQRMNDVDFAVDDVLQGIDAAHRVGLGPIKINMVVKRGMNDHEILPMARHFRGTPYILRFIEYMDVGAPTAGRWTKWCHRRSGRRISAEMPLEPVRQLQRRDRNALALRRRQRRDRPDLQCIPGILCRLYSRAPVDRG